MKTLLSLCITVVLLSCSQPKSATATASTTAPEVSMEDMIAEGFIPGVINSADSDSGCDYTIKTKKYNYLLDPTNLEDEFKKDGLNVWLKHRALRMMNRCPGATPVEIMEMTSRN